MRCSHTNGNGSCDRYLAKLDGGTLVLYCPRCKTETRIPLAMLVKRYADEARELENAMTSDGNRLMW